MVLVAALAAGITLAGREVAQLVEEVPHHEQTLRGKARVMHLLLGAPGIWQRAAETLSGVEQEGAIRRQKPSRSRSRSRRTRINQSGCSSRDRTVRLMGVGEIGRST
jgi:hypothetical protein